MAFDLQPVHAYAALEMAGSAQLREAIDDALDALEADPGSAACGAGPSAKGYGASRSATSPTTG